MIYFLHWLEGNMPAIFADCAFHALVQTSLLFQRLLVADYVPRVLTGNMLSLVTYSTARIHRPITMYSLSEGIKSHVPWCADITQYSGNSFSRDFSKSQHSLSISRYPSPSYGTSTFITVFTIVLNWTPSWARLTHSTPTHSQLDRSIVLQFIHKSPERSLPLRFSHYDFMRSSSL
jgi:hypothetical protein